MTWGFVRSPLTASVEGSVVSGSTCLRVSIPASGQFPPCRGLARQSTGNQARTHASERAHPHVMPERARAGYTLGHIAFGIRGDHDTYAASGRHCHVLGRT
jgi:hypothetical protein